MHWIFQNRAGTGAARGERRRRRLLVTGMSLVLGAGAVAGALAAHGPVAHRAVTAHPASLTSADEPGADLEMVAKTASSDTFSASGQVITYTFDVTRTGNGTATGVNVTDSRGQSCYIGNIHEGTTGSCWIEYVTTPQDVANGQVQDTATASSNNAGTVTSNPVTVHRADGPAIGLGKMAGAGSFAGAHVPIAYTYHVTNPGAYPLTDIRIRDTINGHEQPPGFAACDGDHLAVGAQILECHARYETTQADVDRGEVVNHATVTAHGDGHQVTRTASQAVSFAQGPSVGLSVIPEPSSFAVAGQPIFYHYTVANTGSVPLSDIDVSDKVNGDQPLAVECGEPGELGVGADTLECESEYA
ncbi:MAG: hypothetical protein J2P26_08720, partial [Nocardiopsaceae bacterium]|nr:hypothetical protein [Nocardiopsaceae bacterium]